MIKTLLKSAVGMALVFINMALMAILLIIFNVINGG